MQMKTNEVRKPTLFEALEATGLKQNFISEKLGISPTYYGRFVNNTKFKPEQLLVIEELTGLDVEDIDWP